MAFSFNLIDQPWIPVVRRDGTAVEMGLRQLLLGAYGVRDFACETPLMNAAMMPLVLAILHRVFGPTGTPEWKALWEAERFPQAPLDEYFATWYARFDLFHPERPFYQAYDDRVMPKSIIHLVHAIGNTGTLFIHVSDQEGAMLTAGEAARRLIAAQSFRTASLSGLKETFTDGPLSRGALFWARGDNLFKSFMLNLLPYPGQHIPIRHIAEDTPFWEQEDPFERREYPKGYLDYLTWPSKRINLLPLEEQGQVVVETMTIAPGLSLASDVICPQKRYSRKSEKDDWQFLYFHPEKALWRDYHSLLPLNDDNVRPPAVVEWLFTLIVNEVIDEEVSLQLEAIGMLADQAKPILYRQEQLPLPPIFLRDVDMACQVNDAIVQAGEVASALNGVLNLLAAELLMRNGNQVPEPGDRHNLVNRWGSMPLYWERLEPVFWDFLESLSQGDAEAQDSWQEVLYQSARDALAEAIRSTGTSAAALRGQVLAERRLRSRLRTIRREREEA